MRSSAHARLLLLLPPPPFVYRRSRPGTQEVMIMIFSKFACTWSSSAPSGLGSLTVLAVGHRLAAQLSMCSLLGLRVGGREGPPGLSTLR